MVCSSRPKLDVYQSASLKYNQKLCRVKWFLAIELSLFSKIMQTIYHSKELSKRNLIIARVVKIEALVPWEFEEVFWFANFRYLSKAHHSKQYSKAQVFVNSNMKLVRFCINGLV